MSPLARAITEMIRAGLAQIERLDPAEQDAIIGALVADLRSRRPMAVVPLSVLPEPEAPNRDPRG